MAAVSGRVDTVPHAASLVPFFCNENSDRATAINRMPATSIVKKIYKWKRFTGRPIGRPKSRWEDDVRNDLKNMKLMKWAEQVQDRLKWKDIVEKAKTPPEL
jgi:hypothetical protein